MKDLRCVFDFTGIENHWDTPAIRRGLKRLYSFDYMITHNLFASESEALYKMWNKEFEDSNLPQESYEAFIAAKMNSWLDKWINLRIPSGERIFSWHADPSNAQLVGTHNEYPDVTIRMHLEA